MHRKGKAERKRRIRRMSKYRGLSCQGYLFPSSLFSYFFFILIPGRRERRTQHSSCSLCVRITCPVSFPGFAAEFFALGARGSQLFRVFYSPLKNQSVTHFKDSWPAADRGNDKTFSPDIFTMNAHGIRTSEELAMKEPSILAIDAREKM